jgi:protein-S-isoprenylcysteine O-methyltransferase Ste14
MTTSQPTARGFAKLQEHLPALKSPFGWAGLLALPVLLFLFIGAFFAIEDIAGGWWLLDGEVVILTLGFLSLSLFFKLKKQLHERFATRAYAVGFTRFVAPGLAVIVAVIVRIRFIGGPRLPQLVPFPILTIPGWLLLVIGLVLWLRAVRALGVDSLTMTYVYYPREGEFAQHAIYQLIRHPIYAAAQCIAYGLALLNGSWFALTLALIFSLEMWGWVRLIEEKELIERFGESYAAYRRQVPAFWPRASALGRFLTFLLGGKTA